MTLSCVLLFLAFLVFAVWLSQTMARSRSIPLPPGPQGDILFGVKGSLPRSEPWKTYFQWSKLYQSPLISFRVYNKHIMILNDATSVHELLERRAHIHSDRPKAWMYHDICDRKKSVFNTSSLDPRHRQYRRLLHQGIGPRATVDYWPVLQDEVATLISGLEADPNRFEQHFRRSAAGVIMKMAYGYTVTEDDPFIKVAEEGAKISGWATAPGRWLVDYYPILRFIPSFFPGAGWKRQGEAWRERLRNISDVTHQWAKERIASGSYVESFTSRLLRPDGVNFVDPEEEDIIKWCAGGLYAGAADTTVSALISFLLLMALYPDVQQKAQAEIDEMLGDGDKSAMPHPSKLDCLTYLNAVLKEVLRYAPIANLALPHRASEEDVYNGYLIPKDTTIVANVWAIMHDETLYPDPFLFLPERHMGLPNTGRAGAGIGIGVAQPPPKARESVSATVTNNINIITTGNGNESGVNGIEASLENLGSVNKIQPDPRSFAFGFGRRTCPGVHFAETTMLLTMACILARFDVSLPPGISKPEVEFTTGITSHIKAFNVNIVPRSAVPGRS
ncbi:hypothetical protein AMATHDRAFT_67716 [Amanita thiersii Skay4041]|uniref:Cytochrome P450 n=1 Tax=Amanita thiersii Skay4041 TaxID=703135 RepID=A0A2A9NIH7_9AGAR|nr:hypothetical protein AMATHDRAFT_67716 [Amanita thiersii Skay4041]